MEGKVKLGISINGEELYKKLVDSEYMKKRGYKILYASAVGKPCTEKKIVEGIEFEQTSEGEPQEYRLCYYTTNAYCHIRGIPASQKTSEFDYWTALGDIEVVQKDLANLVKEIKGESPRFEEPKSEKKKIKMETVEEVLKETVDKIKEAGRDTGKIEAALEEMINDLPEGDIKNFFLEVKRILAPAEEIMEEEDEERLDEALAALRAAKAKFKKNEVPAGVPSEIVKTYKDLLGEAIAVCKMIKGFTQLFE